MRYVCAIILGLLVALIAGYGGHVISQDAGCTYLAAIISYQLTYNNILRETQ